MEPHVIRQNARRAAAAWAARYRAGECSRYQAEQLASCDAFSDAPGLEDMELAERVIIRYFNRLLGEAKP